MVVLEQNTSSIQKTKMGYEFFGKEVSSNSIITYTKTNAQVSYDLNKMKIKVDSINKKLLITELPDADIRITPSVEIQSVDDSFLTGSLRKTLKTSPKKQKIPR
uniref:Auto-transporter adhesin head GIN domain-containing protein n=1 Tax=Chryseobacterium endophyticum TaxID=1854762 RepID=A0AAU6WJI4_9FLAO